MVIRPREALLFPRTFFNAVLRSASPTPASRPAISGCSWPAPRWTSWPTTTLDIVALGGEASSVADIRALWAAAPRIRVFNRYGPTETTIAVTHIELTPRADGRRNRAHRAAPSRRDLPPGR